MGKLDLKTCGAKDGDTDFSKIQIMYKDGKLVCCDGDGGCPLVLPMGSYQLSCDKTSLQGVVLTATCRDKNGNHTVSTADVSSCDSYSFLNNNGKLTCCTSTSDNCNLPGGTYAINGECTEMRLDGNMLHGTCKDLKTGTTKTASIDVTTCKTKEFFNSDGNLKCCITGCTPGTCVISGKIDNRFAAKNACA